jgi:hypothetical protein
LQTSAGLLDRSNDFTELELRLDEVAQFEFTEADSEGVVSKENPGPARSRSRNSFRSGTRWSNRRR